MSIRESCEAIEPLLAPYNEPGCAGVLTADEEARVETHLAHCPPCRAAAEACAQAREAIRASAADLTGAAPGLLAARCRAIAARAERPRRARRWMGWSALGATTAVILFIFLMPTQAVATQLAVDHLKCEKLSVRSGTPAELESNWLQRRQRKIRIPDTNAADGVRLVGLRRCLSTDGNMAHLLYERGVEKMSLFVLDGGGALDRGTSELGEVEALGHKAILWTVGAATYVLVGKGANMMPVAARMRDETMRRRTDE